jgi:hypothetical protein
VSENLTRGEIEAMQLDILADISELQGTLDWLSEELKRAPVERVKHVPAQKDGRRGYTKLDLAKLRTFIQRRGTATIAEIAENLGVSDGQVRYKCEALYEAGTLMRVKSKGRVLYSIAKPVRGTKRAKPPQTPRLRVLPGGDAVPLSGKNNPKVRKRAGKITGTKGSKR